MTYSSWSDAAAGHIAVVGQHEYVIAKGLEVVGGVIAAHVPFVVQVRHLLVRLLRQVAAETARVPGGMAGDAAHPLVLMGTFALARSAAPVDLAVVGGAYCLGHGAFRGVMLVGG